MTKLKLGRVNRTLNKNKVNHPKHFARNDEVWSDVDSNGYLQSAFNGRALTPIVLADIRDCLEHALENSDKASERDYHTLLNAGFESIGLDGGNRSKVLWKFFNNQITYTGPIRDSLGNKVEFVNKFWKDIPAQHRSLFIEKEVPLMIVSDAPFWELSNIFLSLQKGAPLNPQECRAAFTSPMAETIRELADTNVVGLSRLFKSNKIKRLDHQEFLAKAMMSLISKYTDTSFKVPCALNKKDIDDFYLLGGNTRCWEDKHSYDVAEVQRATDIINRLCTVFEKITAKTKLCTRTAWFSLFCVEHLFDRNLEIKDYNKFWDSTLALEKALTDQANYQWILKQQQALANKENPATKEFQAQRVNYYFHWSSRTVVPADRTKLRDAIQTALDEGLTNQGFNHFGVTK